MISSGMGAYDQLEPTTRQRVEAAVERSFVSRLGERTRRALLASASLRAFGAGQTVAAGRGGLGGLTVSGVLRVFDVAHADDPGLTHRNPTSGEPFGLGALLDVEDAVWIVALTPAEVLAFDLRVVARLRSADDSFQRALLQEMLRRYRDLAYEGRIRMAGSIRQRLIRELLDRAALEPGEAPLVLHVSNEQLADAVGARREVVNRNLNHLARLGLLRLGRAKITIVDLVALRAELAPPRSE